MQFIFPQAVHYVCILCGERKQNTLSYKYLMVNEMYVKEYQYMDAVL